MNLNRGFSMHYFLQGWGEFMRSAVCKDFDSQFPPALLGEKDLGICSDFLTKMYCFRYDIEEMLIHENLCLKGMNPKSRAYKESVDEIDLFIDEIIFLNELIRRQMMNEFKDIRNNTPFRVGVGWHAIEILDPTNPRYRCVPDVPVE